MAIIATRLRSPIATKIRDTAARVRDDDVRQHAFAGPEDSGDASRAANLEDFNPAALFEKAVKAGGPSPLSIPSTS